jgi:hypothetical protein
MKRLLITLFVPHYRNAPPTSTPRTGILAKYNENLNNIIRFGSDYLPYVSDTNTRPDSLTGIAILLVTLYCVMYLIGIRSLN